MSKQCEIVQDLLPLYVDGACSEASAEMVKEHITTCADCNAIYQQMLSHTSEDILHEESKSVIERHETKEKRKSRRNITIAVLTSIAICVVAIITVFCLLPVSIDFGATNIDLAFDINDVESVEMYHYIGTPASAEKKIITDKESIHNLYEMFEGLSLKKKKIKGDPSEAKITSFRFNLSDGTDYEIVYTEYGVKTGMLSSESGEFEFFTIANIGWYWEYFCTDLEVVPADESELPK
jgi:hypothetical protein